MLFVFIPQHLRWNTEASKINSLSTISACVSVEKIGIIFHAGKFEETADISLQRGVTSVIYLSCLITSELRCHHLYSSTKPWITNVPHAKLCSTCLSFISWGFMNIIATLLNNYDIKQLVSDLTCLMWSTQVWHVSGKTSLLVLEVISSRLWIQL